MGLASVASAAYPPGSRGPHSRSAMALLPSSLHPFLYAARGLAHRVQTVLFGPVYDLGDLSPDTDEVLAQLLERNG